MPIRRRVRPRPGLPTRPIGRPKPRPIRPGRPVRRPSTATMSEYPVRGRRR